VKETAQDFSCNFDKTSLLNSTTIFHFSQLFSAQIGNKKLKRLIKSKRHTCTETAQQPLSSSTKSWDSLLT
jgi:hypothetical protein